MSILFENETGTLLSAEDYINSMINIEPVLNINPNLFKILSPYSKSVSKKTRKRIKPVTKDQEVDATLVSRTSEVLNVQEQYSQLLPILRSQGFLKASTEPRTKNTDALETADFVYEESGKHLIKDAVGSNFGPVTIKTIQNCKYIFPENCQFFCKDVDQIDTELQNKQFDLIVLDPPWWNKYIRRKRKKCPHAYNMMYNCDLKNIPIEKLLYDTGILVVWCTNSPQHLNYLIDDIFPKWKVNLVAKWYWLKVTVHGEPICEFSKPPGKEKKRDSKTYYSNYKIFR